MTKKEIAEVFANFVNEEKHKCFDEKSEKEILDILKKLCKGVRKDTLKQFASNIKKVFDKFSVETKTEIEVDLEGLTEYECEEFHTIAEHLYSPFSDEDNV